MISLKATRKYPSLPAVGQTADSHVRLLESMSEALATHERRTRDVMSSFVRVQELIDLGLAKVEGTRLVLVFEPGTPSTPGTVSNPLSPVNYNASHSMILTDAYKGVTMDVATANDFTIQDAATVPCDIGCVTTITQLGVGQTSIVAAGGVSLEYDTVALLAKCRTRYSTVSIWQRATDIWVLSGDLDLV